MAARRSNAKGAGPSKSPAPIAEKPAVKRGGGVLGKATPLAKNTREVVKKAGAAAKKAASAVKRVSAVKGETTKVDARPRTRRRRPDPGTIRLMFDRLRAMYPDAHCELDHRSPFELLCATVLSAQTTDVNVNKVTPKLFAAFPTAEAMAKAEAPEVEELISSLGFYRQKAKNLVALARKLVEKHGGQVPRTLPELVELPGVGRKTANVVLGVAFGAPEGVVVDTHVQRVSQRLGWTTNTDPVKIEQDLCKVLPRETWDIASHVLIFHGRRTCAALRPACERCGVNDTCPSAFAAVNVGRKPPRSRSASA